MITVNHLSMQFGGQWLFQHVDLQFTAGNCYGIIGANGAGKSTFLRILSGELDSTSGAVTLQPGVRMSVLKQDQFAYDAHTVLDTVMMGNERLYQVGNLLERISRQAQALGVVNTVQYKEAVGQFHQLVEDITTAVILPRRM